jgi:hypothetical protein
MKWLATLVIMLVGITMFTSWGLALSESGWWFLLTFASGIACSVLTPWIRKVFDTEIEKE